MVIELDNDHGILDTIIKRIVVAEPANPAKVGLLLKPTADLLHTNLPGFGGQIKQVLLQYLFEQGPLGRRELGHRNALVWHYPVVSVRAAQMSLVVVVPSSFRHGRVAEEFVHLCFGLLLRTQALHQLQSQLLLLLQDAGALVRSLIDQIRLGTGEPRRDDHLRFVQENVQTQMVAVERKAPRSGSRRPRGRLEQNKVIRKLVAHPGSIDEVAQEAVDAHRAERFGVALGGERGLEHGKDGVADRGRDFVEPDALVAEKELGVGPGAPFGGVDVVGGC